MPGEFSVVSFGSVESGGGGPNIDGGGGRLSPLCVGEEGVGGLFE